MSISQIKSERINAIEFEFILTSGIACHWIIIKLLPLSPSPWMLRLLLLPLPPLGLFIQLDHKVKHRCQQITQR